MCGTRYVSKGPAAPIPHLRWGLLYGIVFFGLAALALVDVDAAGPARPVLDGAVGGAVLVGIAFWIRSNRVALDQQDWCECAANTLTVRVIPSRRPEPSRVTVRRVPESLPVDTHEETWAVGVTDR